ncbi:uncharacterized protein LOC115677266 [Syzygium oleosum]|uniref:uncharacterized protein LOC115677266 n=1 Tax=Syzygium oleosum TaxID=219896 RepID=UPI0024BB902A|nr:uncharacterized protein LOC115677266 [Syzygium oleosum]XP_056176842.1 uncharacterized protein LOC115677266 [Syzygium oleosum]
MAALSSSAMTTAAAAAAAAPPPPPPPPATVAFTTPQNYAGRLSRLLAVEGHAPLWCPTLSVGPTPQTISSLRSHLLPPALEPFSAVAFTSRAGIAAFSAATAGIRAPLLAPHGGRGGAFIVAALGKDADLLSRICPDPRRIETLVPRVASPRGLVGALGRGDRRTILCPVPLVVGIEEPPVVPEFIADLEANGWAAVRVGAYETRWLGEDCAGAIASRAEGEGLDAILFTSSGEVEGLLKSLKAGFGWEWEDVRRRWPDLLVVAHGPVTAAGAERLGVGVDVVGHKFESFGGVVEALTLKLQERKKQP